LVFKRQMVEVTIVQAPTNVSLLLYLQGAKSLGVVERHFCYNNSKVRSLYPSGPLCWSKRSTNDVQNSLCASSSSSMDGFFGFWKANDKGSPTTMVVLTGSGQKTEPHNPTAKGIQTPIFFTSHNLGPNRALLVW
jgi:hypothetical protein